MDAQRLLLFIVFTLSLAMLWEAWQRENAPAPIAERSTTPPAPASPQAARSAATAAGSAQAVPAAVATAAAPVQHPLVRVRTDLLLAEIDTLGGDLAYLELLQQKDTLDQHKNFVLLGPEHRFRLQSGLIGAGLPNHRTLFTTGARDLTLAPGQNTVEVRLEASTPEGIRVTKVITFHRGSYLIDVREEVSNGSSQSLATHAYFQLTRDDRPPAGEPSMVKTFTGIGLYTEQSKFEKIAFSDIDKGRSVSPASADNGWIAMVQHYFVAALLPPQKTEREYYARKLGEDYYSAGVILTVGPVAPGASAQATVSLYAGPEDQDSLKAVAPGLELVVDYGWLTIVAVPLFWVLKLFHSWSGNWGVAIILLTIVIKLIFFPLSAASYRSMARMKQVTPRLMRIREQYADDRAKMNQAMMELYKSEKINPLGGCLPILVQIPVFIALYWVLLASVELRHAPFVLWIKDLSAEDPWYVLPSLMLVSMLIQTRMNPKPPDPVQAKVMMIMPFVFGVMFYFFPSGLVLYWLVNNILSILQQWQITRMIEGKKAVSRH